MRTIIAGTRTLDELAFVVAAVQASGFTITEVVSGCARGIDRRGEEWAAFHNVPVKRFPANWAEHGKAAGPLRNREMCAYAEAAIFIWDGISRGTEDCIAEARRRGLKVFVYRVSDAN